MHHNGDATQQIPGMPYQNVAQRSAEASPCLWVTLSAAMIRACKILFTTHPMTSPCLQAGPWTLLHFLLGDAGNSRERYHRIFCCSCWTTACSQSHPIRKIRIYFTSWRAFFRYATRCTAGWFAEWCVNVTTPQQKSSYECLWNW